jgi:hypothetical protein
MSLGGENLSVPVHFPSRSCLWSASARKGLPSHRSRQQASSRLPRHRLSLKVVRPCPLVLELRASSSVHPPRLSVSRRAHPVRLLRLTKCDAPSHPPYSVSLGATEAWGSGTTLSDQPLLSAVGTSRAKRTTEAKIVVSGCAGVRLRDKDR